MSKKSRSKADTVFGLLLLLCLLTLVIGGIAWARGWEDGAFVMMFAGCLANVPMFHFAMNWPLRGKEKERDKRGEK